MHFLVVLPLASSVLALRHTFDIGLPHPALWNSTCNLDDENAFLAASKYPMCPTSHDATTDPFVDPTSSNSSSTPWTEVPACLETDTENPKTFCIYTSSTFARNRGISIFTTPALAEHLAQNAAFTNPDVLEGVNVESNPPYTVQPLPGRGMGVVINRTLQRGDTIFSYNPVFIIHRDMFEVFNEEDRFPLQTEAVERLPKPARDLFLGLTGQAGTDKVDDIIHTNSFQVNFGEDEEAHNIVLPETSRINHDCRPNAHYYFDVHTLTHQVHAIRTIHAGEELTISYTDGSASRAERKAAIMRSWGFDCLCSSCTQRDIFSDESDNRLKLISELEEHLGDWTEESLATPEMAETVISLYEQERLHAPIAIAYTYAALAYSAVGKEWEAIKYAWLAVELSTLNSGPHFSDVQAMKEFLAEPHAHWSWELRLRK